MEPKLPWISVLDNLPPAGENVLFWYTFENYPDGLIGYGFKSYDDDTDTIWIDKLMLNSHDLVVVKTVTHWLKVTAP